MTKFTNLPTSQNTAAPNETLAGLDIGASGVVIKLTCIGAQRDRMMDLGILPGTRITAEMRGPMGDPTAYRIRGALIALRREQATTIHISPDPLS
ncbi:MAG: FeoA family protein [Chloroflexi bacterium]|nr:FeoA family protein [Chloroflexota bacterium]